MVKLYHFATAHTTGFLWMILILVDSSIHSDSLPTLYVIQEGINCMETTDYFFTNIKPALIIVTHPAATQDPVSQQTLTTR